MKPGADMVGVAMGLLTIPMALLSLAGGAAGLALLIGQHWLPLFYGLLAFVLCSILAPLLERVVIAIDDAANHSRDDPRRAHVFAAISGALPVAVILVAEVVTLRWVLVRADHAPQVIAWAWGYAAATAPWTLFAERVSRFRRTLVGIRAYAGHVALWLFSLLALWLKMPVAITAAAMLLPAILPFTVGLLLALANREAIANVRV